MDFKTLMEKHAVAIEALPFAELKRSLHDDFTTLPEVPHMWILARATGEIITTWSEAFVNASRLNAIAVLKKSQEGALESCLEPNELAEIAEGYVSFRAHDWLRSCFTEYRNITNGRWAVTAAEHTAFKSLPIHLG